MNATLPAAAALALLALAAAGLLWAHLGAAVFFETVRAGFALCGG